jgi:hypothetical protein
MRYCEENFDKILLYSMEVTTNIGCRLNCRFCPQDIFVKAYYKDNPSVPKMLSMENFKTIHSRLEENSVVTFSGLSEPFANPELVTMIMYAHKHDSIINLYSTLVGVSRKDLSHLQYVPFQRLILHIPDEKDNSKFQINEEYICNLKWCLDNLEVTNLSCHGMTHHSVRAIVEKSGLDIDITMHDRCGNVNDPAAVRATSATGRIVCASNPSHAYDIRWFSPAVPSVLPDGRVIPCCMDFGMKHVLGNLLDQSWEEIRANETFGRFYKGFEDNGNTLCRRCICAFPMRDLPSTQLKSLLETEAGICRIFGDRKMPPPPKFAIMGLGSLFREKYFVYGWDEAIKATVFVDNNSALWGKKLRGMTLPSESGVVESPEALRHYPEILVVTFVRDDVEMGRQLDDMNINHANIFELLSIIVHA